MSKQIPGSRSLKAVMEEMRAYADTMPESSACKRIGRWADEIEAALVSAVNGRQQEVSTDDIKRLVKRWFAAAHRTSPSRPHQRVACRILVELMELIEQQHPDIGGSALAEEKK